MPKRIPTSPPRNAGKQTCVWSWHIPPSVVTRKLGTKRRDEQYKTLPVSMKCSSSVFFLFLFLKAQIPPRSSCYAVKHEITFCCSLREKKAGRPGRVCLSLPSFSASASPAVCLLFFKKKKTLCPRNAKADGFQLGAPGELKARARWHASPDCQLERRPNESEPKITPN